MGWGLYQSGSVHGDSVAKAQNTAHSGYFAILKWTVSKEKAIPSLSAEGKKI